MLEKWLCGEMRITINQLAYINNIFSLKKTNAILFNTFIFPLI